jgi:hypothetical protein
MNKLRSDSMFSQLTPEQVETLEGWLFEENLSYKEALERVRNEFKVEASLTGLRRFYRRLAMGRHKEDFVEMASVCTEALKECAGDGKMYAGLLALAMKTAVELAVQKPDRFREFTTLFRAVTSAQGMEMKRVEFQREEERIARSALWRQEEELKKKKEEERDREWARLQNERNEAREAKRKATIAAKKAALESSKSQAPSAHLRQEGFGGQARETSNSEGRAVEEKVLIEGTMTNEQGPFNDKRENDEAPMSNDERMTNVQGLQGSAASAPEAEKVKGKTDAAEKSMETIVKAEGANILALPEVAAVQPKKLSPEETALRGGYFRIVRQGKPHSAA